MEDRCRFAPRIRTENDALRAVILPEDEVGDLVAVPVGEDRPEVAGPADHRGCVATREDRGQRLEIPVGIAHRDADAAVLVGLAEADEQIVDAVVVPVGDVGRRRMIRRQAEQLFREIILPGKGFGGCSLGGTPE